MRTVLICLFLALCAAVGMQARTTLAPAGQETTSFVYQGKVIVVPGTVTAKAESESKEKLAVAYVNGKKALLTVIDCDNGKQIVGELNAPAKMLFFDDTEEAVTAECAENFDTMDLPKGWNKQLIRERTKNQ